MSKPIGQNAGDYDSQEESYDEQYTYMDSLLGVPDTRATDREIPTGDKS